MKKQLLFITLAAFMASKTAGQEIVNTDLQVAGRLYKLGVNTTAAASISPGAKGTGLIWDFSSLAQQSLDTVATLIPANTPYGINFPNASNAVITTDSDGKTYSYYTVSANKVEVTGIAYESYKLTASPKVALKTITALAFYTTLPLKQGLQTYSKGTYIGRGKYTGYPTVDSIEVTMVLEKWDTVDASGSIKIPGGTSYDVIRLKSDSKRTLTFRVKSSYTGWTIPPAPYNAPNIAEQITYNFWTKYVGNEVFKITYDSPTATSPSSAKWFLNTITGIEDETTQLNLASLSPNPASSQLNLNGIKGSFDLQINNMQGENVMTKKSLLGEQVLDISSLPAGLYVATLQNANGNKVKAKFIVQR